MLWGLLLLWLLGCVPGGSHARGRCSLRAWGSLRSLTCQLDNPFPAVPPPLSSFTLPSAGARVQLSRAVRRQRCALSYCPAAQLPHSPVADPAARSAFAPAPWRQLPAEPSPYSPPPLCPLPFCLALSPGCAESTFLFRFAADGTARFHDLGTRLELRKRKRQAGGWGGEEDEEGDDAFVQPEKVRSGGKAARQPGREAGERWVEGRAACKCAIARRPAC